MFAWQTVCLTKLLKFCFEILTGNSGSLYRFRELSWILGELLLFER